jgi:two-component system sensor histidine kinase HydH
MKWRLRKEFIRPAYMFSSPWLLAAAGGLLIMIVVTFAFHNLRLEERLMTNAMLQKASTLIRVLHSGARASFINDLRKDYWNNEIWTVHVQRVIDHLAEDPDLLYFMVVDAKGRIIAHNQHARVHSTTEVRGGNEMEVDQETSPKMVYAIRQDKDYGRVFETVRPFTPVFPSILPMPIRPLPESHRHLFFHQPDDGQTVFRLFPEGPQKGTPHFVVIGLDMREFDRTLRRLQMQIFMLSLAMLFVGLGGWFSLSAVQGFRVSQKTLEDMQAFTSLLIARLPVGVIATDGRGRITTWNQAIAQLTGQGRSEATGRRPQEVLPERLAAFFQEEETGLLAGGDETREITVRLLLGGRRCELLCHLLSIVDSQQQYMGKVLLISDVTEIRSLEQRMRESERLAAVGRMAGGVAHEVRNPLSSIKGLALLLKNKFPAGSKEQSTAELLIQETERMNRTITEMLSFTRPATLNLQQIDLAQLLERSLELIRAEAADNAITTSFDVEVGLLPVLGDVDRLQQVMMNVLINAMQAMEDGGTIAITLKNLQAGGVVELRIHDTGPGIAPDLLSQVFYPYFTTKQGGTGIGLAISQKIIADHGGSIELESEPGKGTTVIVQLPVFQGDDASPV